MLSDHYLMDGSVGNLKTRERDTQDTVENLVV